EVQSEFEVAGLVYSRDQVRVRGLCKGQTAEVRAAKVVLAAGALGNSAILLKSELPRKLPALGASFTCHPQFMTYAYFSGAGSGAGGVGGGEAINAHKGAFQAVKSYDRRFREAGYKLENVYAPPIGTAMLIPGFGVQHHSNMRRYGS